MFDSYDLIERFSIMTVDGGLSDETALEYIYAKYPLDNIVFDEFLRTINAAKSEKEQADMPTNKKSAKSAETEKKDESKPQESIESYLQKGIALIPSKDKKPLIAYSKDESKLIRTLQDLEKWQEKGVIEFGFIPSKAGMIVIDLDKGADHSNKSDGIANFRRLIERNELAEKEIFKDFPNNYPCYTETANGGLHLYFSVEILNESRLKNFDRPRLESQNIELKYNSKVTAAGSVIDGKKYIMHGNLDNIPPMTFKICDMLAKPNPKHKTLAKRFDRIDQKQDGVKWNATPQGIIDKSNELYGAYSPHDYVYHAAVLFERAGFSAETAETYILQTPQHQNRKDQNDTITAIQSIYTKRA